METFGRIVITLLQLVFQQFLSLGFHPTTGILCQHIRCAMIWTDRNKYLLLIAQKVLNQVAMTMAAIMSGHTISADTLFIVTATGKRSVSTRMGRLNSIHLFLGL